MRVTMRCRSFFCPTPSISLIAEGLMTTLYLATALERPHHRLEIHALLAPALVESRDILRVLRQSDLNGVVDHVGNGAVGRRGLQSERPVNLGVEIDRRSFRQAHGQEFNVITL